MLAANLSSSVYSGNPRIGEWNSLIWLSFFLIAATIIRERKAFQMRLEQLSRIDSLTGIRNRLAFNEFAVAEKGRARRDMLPMTVAYVDLDRFKEINDNLGHAVGNRVLVAAAQTMVTHIRHTDAIGRIGGDEFALILPNTHQQAARVLLDKLWQMLAAKM